MKTPGPGFDLASLQKLVDSLPAMIFANRPDGYLDFCNQRMLDFVGLPFQDLEGWKWGGVVHPDDVTPLTERWQESLASGEPFECEARVRRADGEYRWMLHREVAVRDGFGQVVRWYGSSTDIEDRKRAEFEVRKHEAEIRRLFDADIIGIFTWDIEGPILEANDTFLQIIGYNREDLLSGRLRWTDLTPPEILEGELERLVPRIKLTGKLKPWEKEYFHKNGHRVPVLIGVAPLDDESRRGTAFIVDLTELKRAEGAQKRAEAELQQARTALAHRQRVSMLGEVAASLAHEIKQPIAAATLDATTCLRALADHRLDVPAAREAASRMVKGATRADEIIKRTTALYKKDTTRERVEINSVIRAMGVLFQQEAAASSISFRTELAEGLPDVIADRVQLQQVFMNLILNAIEAMKDTGGALTITSHMREEGELLISVGDTGVGLPTDNPDQIFESFVSTKPQGTGMGLAIARSIVESHGGRLWATGNSGPGATFLFTLRTDAGEQRAVARS